MVPGTMAGFNPQSDFDWASVEYFQIIAEHHDLKVIKFWLYNIRIVDPKMVNIQTEKHKEGFIIMLMRHACPPGLASLSLKLKDY